MKAPYYIIAGLLIWIVFRECSSNPEPLPPSIQARQDTIRLDNALIKIYTDSINDLKAQRVSDDLKAKSREKAFKIENRRMSEKLAEARKFAPPEVLESPVVAIQDSIMNKQAGRITELETESKEKEANFTASLKVMELQFNAQRDIANQFAAINQDLYKSLNRERWRGKLWKIAVPAAFVAGFILNEEL